jgi:hypothetical protein
MTRWSRSSTVPRVTLELLASLSRCLQVREVENG